MHLPESRRRQTAPLPALPVALSASAAAALPSAVSSVSRRQVQEVLRRRRVQLVRSRSLHSLAGCFGYGPFSAGGLAGGGGSSGCASDAAEGHDLGYGHGHDGDHDVLGADDSFDSAEAAQERTWVRALRAAVIVGQAAAAGFAGW